MKYHLKYCILALLINNTVYAQDIPSHATKPNIIIDRELQFPLGSLPKKAKWQGLYCHKNSCEMRNTKVQVGKKSVDYLDNELVPIDTLETQGNPIALFPNTNFKTGKTLTFYRLNLDGENSTVETTQQVVDLQKNKKWNMPWGEKSLSLFSVKVKGDEDMREYKITDGKNTQSLFKLNNESHHGGSSTIPVIHWVGDLDGDNKIDLILENPDDNCGFDYRLYLSSKATKTQVLNEALRYTGYQAACGC